MIKLLAFDVMYLPWCAHGYKRIFDCKQLKGVYKCGLGNYNYFKYCEMQRVYFNSYPLHNFYDIHFTNEYIKKYLNMYEIESNKNVLVLSNKSENLFISANKGFKVLQVNSNNADNISTFINRCIK